MLVLKSNRTNVTIRIHLMLKKVGMQKNVISSFYDVIKYDPKLEGDACPGCGRESLLACACLTCNRTEQLQD